MITEQSCRICNEPTEYGLAAIVGCASCIAYLDGLIRLIANIEPIRADVERYLETATQSEIDSVPQVMRDGLELFITAIERLRIGDDVVQFALGEWEAGRSPLRFRERLKGRTAADIKQQSIDDHAFRIIVDRLHREEGEQR
jgi:hypothetical protein